MRHTASFAGTLVMLLLLLIALDAVGVFGCDLTLPQLNQTLSGPVQPSFFGWPVLLDGKRLVIGASAASDGKGLVSVFEMDDGDTSWSLTSTLQPTGIVANEQFGTSFGLFEDVLAAGAPFHNESGAVWIFRYNNITAEWDMEQKLNAPNNLTTLWFGWAITVVRNMIFVSAPGDTVGMLQKKTKIPCNV